jgi:hypothetical protein
MVLVILVTHSALSTEHDRQSIPQHHAMPWPDASTADDGGTPRRLARRPLYGGGAGNRTPVRNSSGLDVYERSPYYVSRLAPPQGLGASGQPPQCSPVAGGTRRGLARLVYAATLPGRHGRRDRRLSLVQTKRPEPIQVWQLFFSSLFNENCWNLGSLPKLRHEPRRNHVAPTRPRSRGPERAC